MYANTVYSVFARVFYYSIPPGSVDMATVYVTTLAATRPSNWYWQDTVASGYPMIRATQWNEFCSRINSFRQYRGLGNYSFPIVYRGNVITASIVNQARTAISQISGSGTLPSTAYTGATITAYYFNQLRDALNAIP